MSRTRTPGTPSLLRVLNDRAALELLLERGPLTRAQLGELTGLSKVTASQLVERLEERQLVARVGELAGGRGPNAQLYAVVPSSAFVVGVHVGPTTVVASSADITGRVTARVEVSTDGADDPVGRVHTAVSEAAKQANAAWERVRRVVLGTPGVPRTIRRTRSQGALACLAASMTAVCTRPTGSSAPSVETSTRAVSRPVMTADPAITLVGPTSTPTTYALLAITA